MDENNGISLKLYWEEYSEEINSFVFLIIELKTGAILKYASRELYKNKELMAKLSPKHRDRISYIAGFDLANNPQSLIQNFLELSKRATQNSLVSNKTIESFSSEALIGQLISSAVCSKSRQ